MKKIFALTIGALCFFNTNAQIIYTELNPHNVVSMEGTPVVPGAPLSEFDVSPLDINNDGSVDYFFRWDLITVPQNPESFWYMHIYGTGESNSVHIQDETIPGFAPLVNPLTTNQSIDNSLNFFWDLWQDPLLGLPEDNNYLDLGDRYIGIKFKINGNDHYGWILVSFETVGSVRTLFIKSFAYNSVPNEPILAGQTNNTDPSASTTQFEPIPINIYPNPSSEFITIDLEKYTAGNITISIRDINGRDIYSWKGNINDETATLTIDVKTWTKGIYMMNLSGFGSDFNGKILVQ